MRAVYSDRHLRHDVTHETILGEEIPAYEVAERAENIREALEADGGFDITGPTDHGLEPILAVHDEGLVRFLETCWFEVRRQGIERKALIPDTWPNPAMFDGMGADAIDDLRASAAIAGRAGWYGLDSSTPFVEGAYNGPWASVGVRPPAARLVGSGGAAGFGLVRAAGHPAARALYAGY